MVTKAHNLKVKNKKFRESLSLEKPAVKKRYQVVYEETFETNVPGTAAHIIFQTKDLIKGKKSIGFRVWRRKIIFICSKI